MDNTKKAQPVQDKKLETEDKLKKELEEHKQKYLRALADYQNFERRVNQEKEDIRKIANRNLILELLPFLDNLDKATIFMKDNGLKMIRDQFYQALKHIGLEEIDVLRKEFDPHTAEAIDVVFGEKDNIVVEVFRKGYNYQGNILRPAQVKVEKKEVPDNN